MQLPSDLFQTASRFVQPDQKWKALAASVISVQADRTITVTVNGSSEEVANVAYTASTTPLPGTLVWVLSDGVDLFAIGSIATDNRTPSPRASRSTNQSIANATDASIDFDGVNSDAWGSWASGANSARLYACIPGRYMAVGQATFEAHATGFRRLWIEKDGTSTVGRVDQISIGAGSAMWVNVTSQPFTMAPGEYIRLMARQNSGGALNVVNSSTYSPSLSLIYLGP